MLDHIKSNIFISNNDRQHFPIIIGTIRWHDEFRYDGAQYALVNENGLARREVLYFPITGIDVISVDDIYDTIVADF